MATLPAIAVIAAIALTAGAAHAATGAPDEPKSVTTQTIKPPSPEVEQDAAPEEVTASVEFSTDLDALPAPVRRMRDHIMEAARTGDPEKMRAVFEANELPPSLPSNGGETDPIAAIKALSGDEEGREILAIMLEILDTGFAHTGAGTPQEMYVWPYFAALPFDALTPEQTVDLYRIITPEDRRGMEEFGQYVFYRIGIGPDGVWHFFLTGD